MAAIEASSCCCMLYVEGSRVMLDLGVVSCTDGDDVLGVTGEGFLVLVVLVVIARIFVEEGCGVVGW